jgi:8-oxo-dGTP diphosphatase
MENANVKMILVNPEGKIFLLHRDDIPNIAVPNKWSFVGGALDEGETPLEGAIRETKEEIDFDAEDVELFKEYDDPTIKRYVYVAKIDKKISELNLTEGDDMGFFSIEEALKMDISKNTRRYIEDYFKGK